MSEEGPCVSGLGGFIRVRRSGRRSRAPWFDDVIAGMAAAPTRMSGVVAARVWDNGGTEFRYRVVRDGRRVRCTDMRGAVHTVLGSRTVWTRRDGWDGVFTEPIRAGRNYVPDDYEFGVLHARWEGDDFTEPMSGPDEITMLGRPAWRIALRPPPHKPEPMQIVLDQQTFLTLHQGNEAFGTYHQWVELDLDPDIDEDTFAWNDDDRLAVRD